MYHKLYSLYVFTLTWCLPIIGGTMGALCVLVLCAAMRQSVLTFIGL